MRIPLFLALALWSASPASADDRAPDLTAPTLLKAGGTAINVDIGHAAPFFADVDGDGKKDLLVGQFGDGKLRIYPNQVSSGLPQFEKFTWFEGKVPSG
ncbi:MAG: hypothetical protein AB7P49_21280 [Bdellovibrionales bacterium]